MTFKYFFEKLNIKSGSKKYRLPTEAEWEYACEAGKDYSMMNAWAQDAWVKDLKDIAWYRFNSDGTTHPVGEKEPNRWGLYDMLGNVGEWCADWKGDYPEASVVDPTGPTTGSKRVIRGGGWNRISYYNWPTSREFASPNDRDENIGFRVLLTGQ